LYLVAQGIALVLMFVWMTLVTSCASNEETERQAEPTNRGRIFGRIVDDREKPLYGTHVSVLYSAAFQEGNIADEQGRYSISAIPGEWWIQAQWNGPCHLSDSTRVRVIPSREIELNFQLPWTYHADLCPCKPGVDRSRLRNIADYAWVCD
jgi:hypothetical protein